MSDTWSIDGQYMEACSCEYVCPCITSNATARATEDFCVFAMTYRIDRGRFASLDLAGVAFALVAQSQAVMSAGNWVMGIVIDARATDDQAAAITDIASGKAGGPMAAFAPLLGEFRGIERHPIRVEIDGPRHTVSIGSLLEQSIEGVPSASVPNAYLGIDNTFHPAGSRLNLATARKSVVDCFGIRWNDTSGRKNGHFAPFSWRGERPS